MLLSEESKEHLPKDEENEEQSKSNVLQTIEDVVRVAKPTFLINNNDNNGKKLESSFDSEIIEPENSISKLQASIVNTKNNTNMGFLLEPQDLKE